MIVHCTDLHEQQSWLREEGYAGLLSSRTSCTGRSYSNTVVALCRLTLVSWHVLQGP